MVGVREVVAQLAEVGNDLLLVEEVTESRVEDLVQDLVREGRLFLAVAPSHEALHHVPTRLILGAQRAWAVQGDDQRQVFYAARADALADVPG